MMPVSRSHTKTSGVLLVSPGTSFGDFEENATKRPSPLMIGSSLLRFSCDPSGATLIRFVLMLAEPAAACSPGARPDRAVRLATRATRNPKCLVVPLTAVTLVLISCPFPRGLRRFVPPITIEDGAWKRLKRG